MIREFANSITGEVIQYEITNLNPESIILIKVIRDGSDVTRKVFQDKDDFNDCTHRCHEDHYLRDELMDNELFEESEWNEDNETDSIFG